MTRYYRFINGECVEMVPNYTPKEPKSPMIKTPTVFNDFHPLTGEFVHDSAQFRRINRDHGVEERDLKPVADNIPVMKESTDDDYIRDVSIAREQLRAGTAPLSEYDREVCKGMNERIKNKV